MVQPSNSNLNHQMHYNYNCGISLRWTHNRLLIERRAKQSGDCLTKSVIFFLLLLLSHLFSATVRVYSLVAPCRLPDLTSLALLGSGSGQRGLSRGPLPGYKTVSKWRLQLQDSIPFLLLSQRLCTTLHTSASLGCYLLFTHMPDCPLAPLGQVWQQ